MHGNPCWRNFVSLRLNSGQPDPDWGIFRQHGLHPFSSSRALFQCFKPPSEHRRMRPQFIRKGIKHVPCLRTHAKRAKPLALRRSIPNLLIRPIHRLLGGYAGNTTVQEKTLACRQPRRTIASMKNILRLPGLVLMLAALTGCLEFEEQTLAYRHDVKSDTIRIFQDYHGIFGGERTEDLSNDEQEQLRSVLTTQRTFFFNNWIFEINHAALREVQENLRDPEKRKEEKFSEEGIIRLEQFLKVLLANSKIENGPLYFDSKGRLCGAQFVTLTKASEILRTANAVIPDLLRQEAAKEETTTEEKAVMLASAERRKIFARVQGNEFTITWPLTRAAYEKSFGAAAEPDSKAAAFKRSGGKASFTDDEVTLTIGSVSDASTALTLPMSDKPYVGNAVGAAKAQGIINDKFDPVAAMKKFLVPAQ